MKSCMVPARAFAAVLFAVGAAVSTAAAQETEDMGKLLVTAQKRAESIQEVPLSVSAITGADLELQGATDFLDYAVRIPSVSFGFSGIEARGARNTISVRGVSGQNTTGYYIDDTPIPYGVDPRLTDIDRIEVLRGPQGTLYGAGSMGGTLKVISARPEIGDTRMGAGAELSSTSEGGENYALDLLANVPLSDRVALRATGYYNRESGFLDLVFGEPLPYTTDVPVTGLARGRREDINESTIYGGRAALLLQLTDNLSVTPTLYYQKTEEDADTLADIDPDEHTLYRAYYIPEPYADRWTLANLSINYDGRAFSFVSSTSWFDRSFSETEDITEVIDLFLRGAFGNPDAVPFPMPIFNAREQDGLVQELRFNGTAGKLDWLAGLYYENKKTTRDAFIHPTGFSANPDYGDLGAGDDFFTSLDSGEGTERALFADVTYAVTEQLELSAGARYFDTEVENDRLSSGLFDAGLDLQDLTQEENGVTPKFGIRYSPSDTLTLYGSAAKGFRLGGTNIPLPSTCDGDLADLGRSAAPDTFDSDTLWNYEAGAKTQWLDRRLTLNASVFRIDWTDIQQSVRLPNCGFNFTANVGEARINGAEFELNALAAERLEVVLSFGYNDGEITDPGAGTSAERGDRLLNVPEYTASGSLQYNFTLLGRPNAFLRLDGRYMSDSFTTFNQDDPTETVEIQSYRRREPFNLWDLRLGLELNDTWSAALFVENLADEAANLSDVASIGLEFPGRPRYVTNRPRTFGVSVRAGF